MGRSNSKTTLGGIRKRVLLPGEPLYTYISGTWAAGGRTPLPLVLPPSRLGWQNLLPMQNPSFKIVQTPQNKEQS